MTWKNEGKGCKMWVRGPLTLMVTEQMSGEWAPELMISEDHYVIATSDWGTLTEAYKTAEGLFDTFTNALELTRRFVCIWCEKQWHGAPLEVLQTHAETCEKNPLVIRVKELEWARMQK